ncbi:hypothetical protein B0H13DRAFT_1866861 [Mycena leptocephala]|nr:hypothetical protein B0H13DRAFT_1866861 [Mycena leptocephala]
MQPVVPQAGWQACCWLLTSVQSEFAVDADRLIQPMDPREGFDWQLPYRITSISAVVYLPINIPPSELGDLDPISEPAIGDGDEIETACALSVMRLGLLRHIACNQTHTAFRRIFTQQHATLENLDPMSGPSFGDCDKIETDTQLFIDNKAGLINSTFKFECFNGFSNPSVQKGPAFSLCGFGDYPNLCIGGNKGQHACGGPKCQFIDWTKARAQGCASAILEYAQVQPAGVVAPCCNSDGCSTPSNPQTAPYTCDTSRTLYLCVSDGAAAECVDPKANIICSGNFSVAAGQPSGTSGLGASQTASSGNGSQSGSHPLSTSAIIGICVGGVVLLLICGGVQKKRRTPVMVQPVPVQPVQEVVTVQMTEYHVRAHSGYYT